MIKCRHIEALDWAKGDGLLPAIIQHAGDGQVLMLGYMNEAALAETLASGRVTFFSRSKQRLWTKGESSGHWLDAVAVHGDCDHDTLLVQAWPQGPTCHLGTASCFGDELVAGAGFLSRLEQVLKARATQAPETSYTARLLAAGIPRCAQKVGEEGVEVALAAVSGDTAKLNEESADLLYHLLVCLQAAGSGLEDVIEVLAQRHQGSR